MQQFEHGLMAEYGMTMSDLDNWSYCGGDSGRHWNYFLMCNTKPRQPAHVDQCICGHAIRENCFIQNREKTRILVLGNCCIKRFVKNAGRTCEVCGASHRSRQANRCSRCQTSKCLECRREVGRNVARCYPCNARLN